MMHQPFTGERFFGDGGSATLQRARRRAPADDPPLRRRCSDADPLDHEPEAVRGRGTQGLRPGRERGPPRPLRLRLLRLLHARGRPHRPRRRIGPQALRHRRADPDHRGRRRRGHAPGTGAQPPGAARSSRPATAGSTPPPSSCSAADRVGRTRASVTAPAPAPRSRTTRSGDARDEGVEGGPELLADRVPLHQDLVPGAGDHDRVAGLEPGREPLGGRRRADRIGAGRDDQRRQAHLQAEARIERTCASGGRPRRARRRSDRRWRRRRSPSRPAALRA